MKRHILGLLLSTLLACHPTGEAKTGTIDSVSIVLVGASEPLPFDPRGGRLTVITRQIEVLVGHPIVLELDTALSPELKASLEESVLASLENVTRELVHMQRNAPAAFAVGRKITRIRCHYDAVIRESKAKLVDDVLDVRSPPHRFPLLEPDLLTEAVVDASVHSLMARWGDVDPAQLDERDRETWFDAMTLTRPGYGYVWIYTRARATGKRAGLRAEHLDRILRLADLQKKGTPLERRITDFLLGEGKWIEDARPPEADPRVQAHYVAWLSRTSPSFDDGQKLTLAKGLFDNRGHEDPRLPALDVLAFGLSVYDGWVNDGAPIPVRFGPRGDLQKLVLCPTPHRGEAETEIHLGCSRFFADVLRDPKQRARLAARIGATKDTRLLEQFLLNVDSRRSMPSAEHTEQGAVIDALAFLDLLEDPALFRHGFRVLFDDHRRREDVQYALEDVAFRWWRDVPARRPFTLLVLGRRRAALHPHYQDSQWEMTVKELGGPIEPDVLERFVAEGPVAAAMIPTMWKALPKTHARDVLAAKGLPGILDRDVATREMRATPVLVQLRGRLCGERDAAGLALVRGSLQGWVAQHPAEAASVSSSIADMTLARCAKTDTDSIR